ncbi:MAG: LysR family transcriptional regulator [Actinomycetia bacterium]|nr:LysR family transcriptional regulator [Actinomycetes bacterium]
MLNPTHLATLQAVLDHGSYVAAAHDLGYTASAISQQMTALEQATGLVLFERLPRGIRPTSSARYLAESADTIVAALRSLERDARAMATANLGELRLGCFQTASARLLPSVFSRLRTNFPEVVVHLNEAEPETLVPAVLDGTLDLVIVYDNENRMDLAPWVDTLVRVPLLVERRVLVLPPGSRRRRQPVRLTSLRDETWVASDPSPSLMRMCARAGFEPRVTLRTNDYYSVCAFVRAGLGVALVPWLGYFLRDELPPHEVSPAAPDRHVFALYRKSNSNPLLDPVLAILRDVAAAQTQSA